MDIKLPDQLVHDYRRVRDQDGDHFPPVITRDVSGTCPNCNGVPGDGGFYAPTGERCSPYHYGGSTEKRVDERGMVIPLMRELTKYPCPVCSAGSQVRKYRATCGVEEFDLLLTEGMWTLPDREDMEQAVQETERRLASSGPSGWLTLVGTYGCGKTYLSRWLVARSVDRGIEARYVLANDIQRELHDSFDRSDVTPEQVLQRYERLPVLVIDQLDWLRQTTSGGNMTYAVEHLLDLLDQRYRQRQEKFTLLVVNSEWWHSNFDLFAPIVSRAKEGQVVVTQMADLREALGDQHG